MNEQQCVTQTTVYILHVHACSDLK